MIRIAGTRPGAPAPVIDWSNKFTVPWCTPQPRIEITSDAKPKDRTVGPTVPNAGLRTMYQKRIDKLVSAMTASVERWVMAAYRANDPKMVSHAADADAADDMSKVVEELKRYWGKKFDEGAERLARYFAKSAASRTDAQLKEILRKAGFSVQFKLTAAQRDIAKAVVAENVSLIKSIPERYFTNVEGMVMRSVSAGRDVYGLQRELIEQTGVTKRRAGLIARDQNAKATAAFNRSRQIEVGITEAIWQHSSAGKDPRPSHVKAGRDRVRYRVAEGWYDPDAGEYIWPGTLINCFPSDTPIDFADGVEIAYRHRYRGKLTHLVTDSGKTLRLTPNHPVATPHGWKAAKFINEGDYVIEISHDIIELGELCSSRSTSYESDVKKAVPSIAEIFSSLSKFGRMSNAVGSAADFHGDGVADSDVDIVRAARPLSFGLAAGSNERGVRFVFSVSDNSLLRKGSEFESLLRVFLSPASFVSSFGQFLASINPFSIHPQVAGLGGAAQRSASFFDASSKSVTSNFILARQSQHARASFVLPTKLSGVVRVVNESFNDHVFNLQTRDGWYSANGIITHNCRCTSRSVIPGFI